jgi:hypothetical protein
MVQIKMVASNLGLPKTIYVNFEGLVVHLWILFRKNNIHFNPLSYSRKSNKDQNKDLEKPTNL